ncbi:hypothetical protein Nepgr_017513 [Nepenthes gracilis]|uniref:Uncharacterized protein n=1 Tax=Nepenthes gracilis TaxID=150966 RepID=A0AAD3XS82_NEPGR|nr:hypothetical protein Nepgr_017513 [Nepenthes gracilis]
MKQDLTNTWPTLMLLLRGPNYPGNFTTETCHVDDTKITKLCVFWSQEPVCVANGGHVRYQHIPANSWRLFSVLKVAKGVSRLQINVDSLPCKTGWTVEQGCIALDSGHWQRQGDQLMQLVTVGVPPRVSLFNSLH